MDPTVVDPGLMTGSNAIALGLALVGGRIVKAIGVKYEKTGGPPVQKVLAPLASIAVAIGVQAATKGTVSADAILAQGGAIGVLASGIHGVAKNGLEFLKYVFGRRPK